MRYIIYTMNKELNIVVVTHNARMRCFLEDVIKKQMNEYRLTNLVKEIRFKNSSILLLRIMKTGDTYTTELSLVYDGIVNKPKPGAYFVSSPVTENSGKIKYIQFKTVIPDLKIDMAINHNYSIYIIRHGEATHNKATVNIYRDTNLTKDGINQAVSVTSFFNSFNKIDYFFSSSLIRTRETIEHIIRGLNKNIYNNKKIIVLPCSHELYYNEAGNCDENASFKPVPPENIKKCSGQDDLKCNKIDYCCKTPSMSIDWSYYQDFYKTQKKCRDTNMIKLLISYVEKNIGIADYQIPNHLGGDYHKKYLKNKNDYLMI